MIEEMDTHPGLKQTQRDAYRVGAPDSITLLLYTTQWGTARVMLASYSFVCLGLGTLRRGALMS